MPVSAIVDRAVRRELGGVDEQLRAVLVGHARELAQRPDLAGDVGGAGDGDQVDRRLAQRGGGDLEQFVGRGRERQQVQVVPAPGQHVRVVLDRGREHARLRGQRGGEDVDGLGGVADEDDLGVGRAGEVRHDLACVLVGGGRDLRLGAGAAVDAAVPRHEGLDDVPDGGQHRSARRVVEVDVAAQLPVAAGHLHFCSEEVCRRHQDAHLTDHGPRALGEPWEDIRDLPRDDAEAVAVEGDAQARFGPGVELAGAAAQQGDGVAGALERVGDGVAVAGRDSGDQAAAGLGEQVRSGRQLAAVELGEPVEGDGVGGWWRGGS